MAQVNWTRANNTGNVASYSDGGPNDSETQREADHEHEDHPQRGESAGGCERGTAKGAVVAATETTDERRVHMTLFNATQASRQVRIVERLPDNARLAPGAPKPAGQTDGAPTWRVTIPAGGQTDFSYRFVIDNG